MSPEDLRALLGLYRDAMAAMRAALDDGRVAELDADQLRALLRDVVKGYEARIAYERAEAALAHAEQLAAAVLGQGASGKGALGKGAAAKPALTLLPGGKA